MSPPVPAKLAAELRRSPATAARSLRATITDLAPLLEERIPLRAGYQAAQTSAILLSPWDPIDGPVDATVFASSYDRLVPQLVIGTSVDNVISGAETGVIPQATLTLLGTDLRGDPLTVEVTVAAKGAYPLNRAFKTFTHLTSDVTVDAFVHLRTGKGFGVSNPFDEDSIQVSINDGITLDTPTLLHGATGTIVPSGAYNAAEVTAAIRYHAAA